MYSVIWVWRSLVARLNGVQEAGSSNLLTQTIESKSNRLAFLFFRLRFFRVNESNNAQRSHNESQDGEKKIPYPVNTE